MDTLINALKQRQEERRINDGELAILLHVHRTTWCYIKSGKRTPGTKFLKAVARVFPELQVLIFAHIASADEELPAGVAGTPQSPEGQ